MPQTTLSSREFNQHVSRAKRAAEAGPVVITERGKPAFVLLRHDEYRKLTGRPRNLRELLVMEDGDDIELDIPKREIDPRPPVEFD
jgi:prevent-host-death family protein